MPAATSIFWTVSATGFTVFLALILRLPERAYHLFLGGFGLAFIIGAPEALAHRSSAHIWVCSGVALANVLAACAIAIRLTKARRQPTR